MHVQEYEGSLGVRYARFYATKTKKGPGRNVYILAKAQAANPRRRACYVVTWPSGIGNEVDAEQFALRVQAASDWVAKKRREDAAAAKKG